MATNVGIETLQCDGPIDPSCGPSQDLMDWIKNMGATFVKLRNYNFSDPNSQQYDTNFVKSAVACAGLKVMTRPGGLNEAPCGEGVPIWNDGANDFDGCVRRSIDRWYVAFLNAVGGHTSWFAHLLANEPNNQSYYRCQPDLYERHLRSAAARIIANGWTWIPFVTPPQAMPGTNCGSFNDGYEFYERTIGVVTDPSLSSAFKYFGFNLYWTTDPERDNYMNLAQSYASRAGKPLLVTETNTTPQYETTCYDGTHCRRTASLRHAFYTLRYSAGLSIFLLTGASGCGSAWAGYDLGPCGQCNNGAIDAEQYRWAMEGGKLP